MSDSPLNDIVSSQYTRWTYPQPILDIPAWLAHNWQWFDPNHAHRMFWPDRPYNPEMDILIAGCGANQGAIFAYTNPKARVVAVDVSQPSLDHHAFLKAKYGLDNLEMHLLPIEDVETLGREFDLIVSTGVLHHLASPEKGMQALASCLGQDGVIAMMLYAKFGRLGVEMLQSVFRDVGLRQNDASVLMVKDALSALPSDHPVKSYVSTAPDLNYDAGLVDTFLHGRDRIYTIDDCLQLVDDAGLAFQDLFLKSSYYPSDNSSSPFLTSVAMMPEKKQWSIMERINFRNGCHFFTACRTDRPQPTYRIEFDADVFSNHIPEFRYRCGFDGQSVYRYNWTSSPLGPDQRALLRQMDGVRSVKSIIDTAITNDGLQADPADLQASVKALLRSMWRLDIVTFGIAFDPPQT